MVAPYATELPTHSGVHYFRIKFGGALSRLTASCTTEDTMDDASLSHDESTVPAPVPHQTTQQLFQCQKTIHLTTNSTTNSYRSSTHIYGAHLVGQGMWPHYYTSLYPLVEDQRLLGHTYYAAKVQISRLSRRILH